MFVQKNGGIEYLRISRYQNGEFKSFWELGPFKNTADGGWEFGQVQLDSNKDQEYWQVVVNAKRGNTSDGYAAVDELLFSEVFEECPTIIGGNGE